MRRAFIKGRWKWGIIGGMLLHLISFSSAVCGFKVKRLVESSGWSLWNILTFLHKLYLYVAMFVETKHKKPLKLFFSRCLHLNKYLPIAFNFTESDHWMCSSVIPSSLFFFLSCALCHIWHSKWSVDVMNKHFNFLCPGHEISFLLLLLFWFVLIFFFFFLPSSAILREVIWNALIFKKLKFILSW